MGNSTLLKKSGWLGHLMRMPNTRLPKTLLTSHIGGKKGNDDLRHMNEFLGLLSL